MSASDKKKLRKGQLLSVDCGLILDGWQSDSAFSVLVGGGSGVAPLFGLARALIRKGVKPVAALLIGKAVKDAFTKKIR